MLEKNIKYIQISSGKGPDECELAVSLFLKTYQKECEKNGIKSNVINCELGNIKGNYKSVLMTINLNNDMELLNGTILWICKSPYRLEHKRKNWYINVETFEPYKKLNFYEQDIKFDTMKSSGPGGQNVNKVETAVRAIHTPTGLTVVASEERTQIMNKKLALARLANAINKVNNKEISNYKKTIWNQHNDLERGNPIRIYRGINYSLDVIF